ncbi:MAG TPA: thioredoxin domain-containing protein [Chthoniobacterales bacterium]|nr:thioredoxin domain-containing protein [Chthoniobacterales bacterium]
MKRYLPFVIVAVVGALTLGAGAMLYRAKRPALLEIPKNSATPDKTASMHVRGQANAAVTLEEFGDFECPPCANLASAYGQIEEGYSAKLRVIFRHFPLPGHPHAQEAALVAEAAGLQGRFWEMHDLLYKEQPIWSKSNEARALFNSYAEMLGLNLERFKTDVDSPEVKERVASDKKRGTDLGVNSTPTIFINDRQVPPPVNVGTIRAAIEAALNPKPSP